MEPAFPALPISRSLNGELVYQSKGLTIRDYFAAKAMQGLLASDVYAPIEKFATQAYAMADAMMEARNESQ
jgi:hypothetical protein